MVTVTPVAGVLHECASHRPTAPKSPAGKSGIGVGVTVGEGVGVGNIGSTGELLLHDRPQRIRKSVRVR
jgi:hypothetical protein